MVKVATYFGMTLGAFLFWETMDKVHVWIALRQDEKVSASSEDGYKVQEVELLRAMVDVDGKDSERKD